MAFRGLPPVLSKKNDDRSKVVTRRPALRHAANVKAGLDIAAISKIPKCVVKPSTNIAKPSTADQTDKLTEQFHSLQVESYSAQHIPLIEDIDEGDANEPKLVTEWVNEIYDYLRQLEAKHIIREDYLKDNAVIRPPMRTILVNWLILIHDHFNLLPETLYLAVATLDRTLQDLEVSRNKLQLVGIASMMVAAKYEEMLSPDVDDYSKVCKAAYSKIDMLQMECVVLKVLDFSLGRPLPLHFLRRNSKAGHSSSTEHTTAKYFMELSLIHYNVAHYPPSLLAAAALCLSFKLLREPSSWTDTLVYHSKYTELELRPIMEKLALITVESEFSLYQSVRDKYARLKFGGTTNSKLFKSDAFKRFAIGLF